jgi:hypothetical protein
MVTMMSTQLRVLSILFKESVLIYFMMTLWLIAAANIVNNIVLILCVLILCTRAEITARTTLR